MTERARKTIDRYELCDQIGSGGMGSVHYGHLHGSAGFGRIVAIKRLHPWLACDRMFVRAFIEEARLAARIRHPNVVPILDALSDGRELFLVLEYVHGEPLHRLLDLGERKLAPIPVVASIMREVLEGLDAAHRAVDERGNPLEIIHRDVSPQNVLVGADGHARVLDFGVATAAGRANPTEPSIDRKGKLSYMAPEQIVSGEVSPASDVYSAAVVLWEAITGRRLFRSNLPLSEILECWIPPPSALNDAVPAALDAVVMRGLERNPALRYTSAREMSLDLERSIGIASEREVAHWVDIRAGARLRQRAERIALIEQGLVPATGATPLPETLEHDLTFTDSTTASAEPNAILSYRFSVPAGAPTEDDEFDEVPGPTRILVEPEPLVVPTQPALIVEAPKVRSNRRFVAGLIAGSLLVLVSALAIAVDQRTPTPVAATAVEESEEVEAPIVLAPVVVAELPVPPIKKQKIQEAKRTPRIRRRAAADPKPCEPPYWIDEEGLKRLKPGCD